MMLAKIFNKCLNKIKSIYKKYYDKKTTKVSELSVADLYFIHTHNGEFLRFDTIVRYITIERYLNNHKNPFDLYSKMQNLRKGDGYSDYSIEKFKQLLDSYIKFGYNNNSKILLDKNLNLVDGSHRFALGLYFNTKTIVAQILNRVQFVEYSLDWFILNNFTKDEIELLKEKEKEIRNRILNNNTFSCVIWSPAIKYKTQILNDLSYYGKIISVKEYSYRQTEYNNIVRAIYAIDDIEKWKIEKKIEHMQYFSSNLVAVDIMITNPDLRQKKLNGMPLSRLGERLKKIIRSKYKNQIENYYYDIIMHIGDNFYQSNYMHNVLEPDINFNLILPILNKYNYALVKIDTPNMPIKFPLNIPVSKDIDIICSKKDFNEIKDVLINFANSHKQYSVRKIENVNNIRIRIEQNNHLIILLDLSSSMKGLTESFIDEALTNRILKNGYYIFNDKYEYIVRMEEFKRNPYKKHHEFYLKLHLKDYDKKLAERFLNYRIEDLLIPSKNNLDLDSQKQVEEQIAYYLTNYSIDKEKISQYIYSDKGINWDKVYSFAYPVIAPNEPLKKIRLLSFIKNTLKKLLN